MKRGNIMTLRRSHITKASSTAVKSDAVLVLGFLDPFFKQIQEEAARIKSHGERKKYAASLKPLLQRLAKDIQRQNPLFELSATTAREILRRKHILFLERYFVEHYSPGVARRFHDTYINQNGIHVVGKEYESKQQAIGKFTNCYHDWKPGLRALRKHEFGKVDETEKLLALYHHSSPVPFGMRHFEARLQGTVENFESLAEQLGQPSSITEVRLLSPSNPLVEDDQKILETYFAAIRSQKNISLFVYGINVARIKETNLQRRINTRATNQLFEKVLRALGANMKITQVSSDTSSIRSVIIDEEIKQRREKLDDAICKIDIADKRSACEEFKNLIREHDAHESDMFLQYQLSWQIFLRSASKQVRQSNIVQAFNLFLHLQLKTTDIKNDKYNGQIQAILIELNRLLGEPVCLGCDLAKDRDGMVSISLEAMTIFYQRYQRYPYPFPFLHERLSDAENRDLVIKRRFDHQVLLHIQQNICLSSTPLPIAEAVSWPLLAHGISGTKQIFSGFQHLPNENTASIFSDLHGEHTHSLQLSDELISGIALRLAKAKKDGDQVTVNAILHSLDHDPLFADIRQLTKLKKLSVLEKHPLLRKTLIGLGIAIGAIAILAAIAAITIFTGGFGGIVLAKMATIGFSIASVFSATLTTTTATSIGIGTIATGSTLLAAMFGSIAGLIYGLANKPSPVDEIPFATSSAFLLKQLNESADREPASPVAAAPVVTVAPAATTTATPVSPPTMSVAPAAPKPRAVDESTSNPFLFPLERVIPAFEDDEDDLSSSEESSSAHTPRA
jgi:hypothetical protein